MSSESLLIFLATGVIAGWIAGQILQGAGLGFMGDMIIGVAGALIGGLLLPQLGVHVGSGIVGAIFNAAIGAVLLLLAIRMVRGGGGWHSRMGHFFGRRW